MAVPLESSDYIPQIDLPPSEAMRASLLSQVEAERPSNFATTLHPLVDTSYTPTFSPLIDAEHKSLQSDTPKERGIDLSRYESDALEPPNQTFPTSDEERPEFLNEWRETLRRAYASSTYLSGRNTNLALLETYGKNSWLVSNWQLEAELKALDTELADTKRQAEELTEERRAKQEAAGAEMAVLEESWKRAVGGVVEVQVATEVLRGEVLEKRSEIAEQ
ncbi:hypothetical protein BT63DRAFT_416342 [Microthyrium microscopicum]|uniref:BCAS2 family protein n=1 Tax=Microthyrium microscopicum TaxID=703497 RepID=A0A6A6U2M3_9PEZI|nr:hypothetical protein BT63DRAFT_416342 [Microthyrium microscopicum]